MTSEKNEPQQNVYQELGQMTRSLHKSLLDLGDQSGLAQAAGEIPDARERLAYVLSMTEQAVSRVLNAVDALTPDIEAGVNEAGSLLATWERCAGKRRDSAEYQQAMASTLDYLRACETRGEVARERLMEIVMAQEFQDLTGQVIKKVVDLASEMETRLLALLRQVGPAGSTAKAPADGLLNGPAMPSVVAASQAVGSQADVDRLLDELGF